VQPECDTDHSPPSSAEVKNEQELYLLSPHVPPWRDQFTFLLVVNKWTFFREQIFNPCNNMLALKENN
jgi:hypothetical protein